jgi:hypothetical protein
MQATREYLRQGICLLLVLADSPLVLTLIFKQTAVTGRTSFTRELQVYVGKSVLWVLDKRKPIICIYYIILKACEINIRTEVKYKTIIELFRFSKEVIC